MDLQNEMLKTLLYYDIWAFPLSVTELYAFLPVNSMTLDDFRRNVRERGTGERIHEFDGYYFVKGKSRSIVGQRARRELHARRMWRMARVATHLIKRFPFVRGVFVSGDLSKNATQRTSDVDFFILTEPGKLWITRTLLVLFKKIFLLNKKKYFCLNSFASTDSLELDEKNIFLANEIAHLKPLYNSDLFSKYQTANGWVREFFPNFDLNFLLFPKVNNRSSRLQKLFELPFALFNVDRLDEFLMKKMERVWAKRYPEFDDETRTKIFRCTRHESRAYVGNFQEKVLALYNQRLKDFGVSQ